MTRHDPQHKAVPAAKAAFYLTGELMDTISHITGVTEKNCLSTLNVARRIQHTKVSFHRDFIHRDISECHARRKRNIAPHCHRIRSSRLGQLDPHLRPGFEDLLLPMGQIQGQGQIVRHQLMPLLVSSKV